MSDFGAALRAECNKAKDDLNRKVVFTALKIFRRLIYRTPADSGRMAANWQIGLGALNPSTSDAPGSDAFARGQARLSSWKPGQTIWMTNSMAYARTIEYGLYGKPPGSANGPKTRSGYSTQAPAGIVRLTVQEFAP